MTPTPTGSCASAGLWFPPDSPERKLFRDRLASNLPAGTFALSNSLAGFLAPWLVVLAGVAWSSLRNRKRLAVTIACLVPLAACLLLTRSRSGCIAAGVGVLLVWLLRRQRRFRPGWRRRPRPPSCWRRQWPSERSTAKDSLRRRSRSATGCNTGNRAWK